MKIKEEKQIPLELMKIFTVLKRILKKYEGALNPKIDIEERYELWTNKEVYIDKKKKKEIFYTGIIIQKNYVGFYLMPIYIDPTLKDNLEAKLLKLLKGKSCFHIKTIDNELEAQITKALQKGYELYNSRGWIE